jgi:hypothetical protein
MSTYDLYTTPVEPGTWDVPAAGAARFSWEYEDGRQRLLDLCQRGNEDIAERVEREQAAEMAARKAEVDAAVEDGAADG